MYTFVVLLMSVFLFASEGLAFKPVFKDEMVYKSTDGQTVLTIVKKGWHATLADGVAKKRHAWSGETHYPSRAIVTTKTKRVVLLGSYGDSGNGLGDIEVRDLSGKVLASWALKDKIPNLEKMSKDFTEVAGPFFWIGKTELSADEATLTIHVCDKVPVTVTLSEPALAVSAAAK